MVNVKNKGLLKNTLIMFTGDNATNKSISSKFQDTILRGGKNLTVKRGTHAPLMALWYKEYCPGR